VVDALRQHNEVTLVTLDADPAVIQVPHIKVACNIQHSTAQCNTTNHISNKTGHLHQATSDSDGYQDPLLLLLLLLLLSVLRPVP
jgi:hypothetical protein